MFWLIAAAATFLLIHLAISGTTLRDGITRTIGEGPYMGLFSLASIAVLVWLGISYGHARNDPAEASYWAVTPLTRWIQLAVTLLAFLLLVPGLLTRNPTSVRQEGALDRPDVATGMLRVTRHPFLWGVALWAAGHLMVNGDRASLILFGTLLVLSVFGTYSIDAKRTRVLGDKWAAFAAKTSNVPFAAIAQGRQTLSLGEIGWWRLALAVILWAAIAYGHPYMFGARALPG